MPASRVARSNTVLRSVVVDGSPTQAKTVAARGCTAVRETWRRSRPYLAIQVSERVPRRRAAKVARPSREALRGARAGPGLAREEPCKEAGGAGKRGAPA